MEIIECTCLLTLFCLCIITAISDIREGLIRNKTLLVFATIALVLDVIYYGFMARDLFALFVINVVIIIVIGLVLFYTHSFAGGDCKLIIVMAMLFPANCYLTYGRNQTTLFFAVGLAILYGYFYFLVISIIGLIQKKNKLTITYVGRYIKSFMVSFVAALVYISFLNLLFVILSRFFPLNIWLIRIICMATTWMVGKIEVLKKWYVIVPLAILDIIMGLVLKTIPFSINPENYLLVVILLLCQMTIKTNLYEEIEISALKKGMILSTISSVLMQNTQIKGMPNISSEDLRSRLTETEIESIEKWGKSKNVSTVMIVKKIPFAIFLSLGFFTYYVAWRWLL